MVVSVRIPKGPFRRIWLPIPSLVVYLGAWVARIALKFVRWEKIAQRRKQAIPVNPARIGPALTRIAWITLCSGPYTFCDVDVPDEGVHVKITLW